MLNERKYTSRQIRTKIEIVQYAYAEGFIEFGSEDMASYETYLEARENDEGEYDSGTLGEGDKSTLGQYDLGSGFDSEGEGEAEGNIKGSGHSLIFL